VTKIQLYTVFNVALISDNPNKLISPNYIDIVIIMIYTVKYLSNSLTYFYSLFILSSSSEELVVFHNKIF